jgi:hypothetical protein
MSEETIRKSVAKAARRVRKAITTHANGMGHLEKAKHCLDKVVGKSDSLKVLADHIDKAIAAASDTADHQGLADQFLTKAATSLGIAQDVGPAEPGPGWDPHLENIERKPQIDMAEGPVFGMDPTRPDPSKWPGIGGSKSAFTNPIDDGKKRRLTTSLLKTLGTVDANRAMVRLDSGEMTEDERRALASKLIGKRSWFGWGREGVWARGN